MARSIQRQPRVPIVRLPHAEGLPLPEYQSEDAAGLDLTAALPETKPLLLKPGARALIPTGLIFELPRGYEAQVRPRSGLAVRHGITVLNSPGTIDADYRGEVQVILVNLGTSSFKVMRGERIAQLVVAPVVQVTLIETAAVGATARGTGGFGSTGLKTVPGDEATTKKAKAEPKRENKEKNSKKMGQGRT